MWGGCSGPRSWGSSLAFATPAAVQSDVDLIRQVAAQDHDAFLELYDRFSARLLGLIVLVMRNRTQAEDVLQQVMLEIWQTYAARYSPALGPVDSWLLRLAKCRAIDWARSASARHAVSAETTPETTLPWTPACQDHSDAQRLIAGAVGGLPEDERVPVILACVHGLSREEIAKQCGVPIGTVKTRLRRGFLRLRESLPAGVRP